MEPDLMFEIGHEDEVPTNRVYHYLCLKSKKKLKIL